MESQRAMRRAQTARVKAKRGRYWGRCAGGVNERHLGMLVHTGTLCSCWRCGNPRRYFGERTVQERRLLQELE
jgi:hypothetical protein